MIKKCSKLEAENLKLKGENTQLKQKLTQYEAAPSVCPTVQFQQILEELNHDITFTINDLVVQINTNRSLWDAELLKYNEEYEHCKKELQKLNLKVSNDSFNKKLKEFKKTCENNDMQRKETFKQLYEIDKLAKDKLEQEKTFSSKYSKEIGAFVKDHRDRLNKIKQTIVQYEINKEKKLYEDALSLGKQETALYSDLLTKYDKNDKEKLLRKIAEPTIKMKTQSNCDDRSIVAINFQSESALREDLLKFLNGFDDTLNLKEEDVEITKTFDGRTYMNLTKIILPSEEILNKILRKEKMVTKDFNGVCVSLLLYKPQHLK